MNYRFSNKLERYDNQDQNSYNYQNSKKPNLNQYLPQQTLENYPNLKSPLQKLEVDIRNPLQEYTNFSCSNFNYNPPIKQRKNTHLNNNPYLSNGPKIIDYSSSSDSEDQNKEDNINISADLLRKNSNFQNKYQKQIKDQYEEPQHNFQNKYQIQIKDEYEEPQHPIPYSNSSQSIPSIHASENNKIHEIDIFQKAFIVGLEKLKKKENVELSPIPRVTKVNQEENHNNKTGLMLDPIIPMEFNFVKETVPLVKTSKNIFNSPICKKTEENNKNQENLRNALKNLNLKKPMNKTEDFNEKNEKDENNTFKEIKYVTLDPIISLKDILSHKDLLPKTTPTPNKKLFDTPIYKKNQRFEDSSNKKKEIEIFENKSNEKKKEVVIRKFRDNKLDFSTCYPKEQYDNEQNESNFMKGISGVLVAERINLIEKKKITEKNDSFESNYTADSNTISQVIKIKNPYYGLLSPLHKI